ncbi:MAG: biotin--[acetyl-CoA-carboxylase] ligase, partial [Rickettsiales bacterium]|nr:biotin--[acetyl-CoA-carboxylase] ligase [Rickettsiales bacterium]
MPLDIAKFKSVELESVGSTNDYAKELARAGKCDFAFIRADSQTAGRTTKKDAPWFSPPGNLYFTALIKLGADEAKHFQRLSFLTAISVVETIEELAGGTAEVKIKWPNDILLNVRKVCGILIEKEGGHAVIGVGLNIGGSPPDAVALSAYPITSLAESGINAGVRDAARILGLRLVENIGDCARNGFADVLEKVRPFMYRIGEQVYVEFAGRKISGMFEGLDET